MEVWRQQITIINIGGVNMSQSIVRDPRHDAYKVSNKTGDLALHDSWVTADNVLILSFRRVVLCHYWTQQTRRKPLLNKSSTQWNYCEVLLSWSFKRCLVWSSICENSSEVNKKRQLGAYAEEDFFQQKNETREEIIRFLEWSYSLIR